MHRNINIKLKKISKKNTIKFIYFNYLFFRSTYYNSFPYNIPTMIILMPYLIIMLKTYYNSNNYFLEYYNRPIGLVSYRMTEKSLYILSLAVDKIYRSFGMGNFLLGYLIKVGRNKEKKFIELEVDVNNYIAIKLYYKNKFNIIYKKNKIYRTSYLMRRKI